MLPAAGRPIRPVAPQLANPRRRNSRHSTTPVLVSPRQENRVVLKWLRPGQPKCQAEDRDTENDAGQQPDDDDARRGLTWQRAKPE